MEDKFDLIEKYLMNEMSVREQVKFEEELRSDPELMKEYLLRKKVNDAVLEDDVMNLRESLGEVMSEDLPSGKSSRKLYIYSAIAAVIILLIVVSNNIFFHNNLSTGELYNKYYSAYPAIMSFRSPVDQSEIESIFYKAFKSYDQKNYKQASKYFKQVIQKDSTNYMGQFYLSICEIETGEFQEAEEYLTDLVLKNNHIFWEQSNWYLAMVYLKMGKDENAKTILNKIVRKNMVQKQEAKSILKSLE